MTTFKDETNGHAKVAKHAHLSLDFNLETHTLEVNGNAPNLDCALNMLDMAKRAYEAQLRQQQAVEFAQQQARAIEDQRIRSMVRKGS